MNASGPETADVERGLAADVEIGAGASEEELVSRARDDSRPRLAISAMHELMRRRSPRGTELLTATVTDTKRDADVRAAAALALGHLAKDEHQQALLEALSARQDTVVRRAADALGRIGDEEAHARLRRLRRQDPAVRPSIDFARTLISYRLGLDRDLLDAPSPQRLAPSQRGEPLDLDVAVASDQVAREALSAAEHEFPAVRLSRDGALHFPCDGAQFFVAFTRQVHQRKTLSRLGQHNAVLMTVMKRSPALQRYAAHMYVLTHPEREGRLRLFGVRTTGLVTLTGEVDLDEREATLRVGSLATPHQVPVTAEAVYDHEQRRITLVRTLVDADFAPGQKGSRQPARSQPPGL